MNVDLEPANGMDKHIQGERTVLVDIRVTCSLVTLQKDHSQDEPLAPWLPDGLTWLFLTLAFPFPTILKVCDKCLNLKNSRFDHAVEHIRLSRAPLELRARASMWLPPLRRRAYRLRG